MHYDLTNMNLRSTILLLLAAYMIQSCSIIEEQSTEQQFMNCLPIEAKDDFQKVLIAFDNLLERDYGGSIDSLTQTIINLNLSDKIKYRAEDIALGKLLLRNNFDQHIYTTYNDTTYNSIYSAAKGKTEKKMRIRPTMRVDKEKNYFLCLLKVMPKDDPLSPYMKRQDLHSVLKIIQDFAWKPGYDLPSFTESGLLRIMLASELYSGMLMRSQ